MGAMGIQTRQLKRRGKPFIGLDDLYEHQRGVESRQDYIEVGF